MKIRRLGKVSSPHCEDLKNPEPNTEKVEPIVKEEETMNDKKEEREKTPPIEKRRCWWHKEGMKPKGTENDLPLVDVERLVNDYLSQHGGNRGV